MQTPQASAPRGRPPTITRARIADAGIQIGLPNITFVGVAAALGVSQMALYKHVGNLEGLKQLVAEEIFSRWQVPRATIPVQGSLEDYLQLFSAATQAFVKANPGITPYVIRRLVATPSMLDKIREHQEHIAQAYGVSFERSRYLMGTVAFHCLAVADTVYAVAGREPRAAVERVVEEIEMESILQLGMTALIQGALAMNEQEISAGVSTQFLDTSALPMARLHEFPLTLEQATQWLDDMETLIKAEKEFVLVYENLPDPSTPGDPEGRKKAVLWLKAHREGFGRYCRGMVMMCEDPAQLPVLQEMVGPLEKVYRVPGGVASSPEELRTFIQKWVSPEQ
ncbi:MAG: TetR/AcrR family transcriptional regulator [Alcaligenes faecalis]|nr:TetR/AcrR family transcriptional regulator [Alcaligenes faecalis]